MKKYLKWFALCVVVFVVSVFAHECGHGIANAIAGIPCSTGFNRVGDIYKYPKQDDFRAYYSTTEPVLLDFGVPCTIALAITGTVLYAKSKKKKIWRFGAALSIGNCLLRFFPCSMVLFTPLFTGKVHVEDEYETGQLLTQLTGNNFWLYVPALFSWAIMLSCLVIMIIKTKKRKVKNTTIYAILAVSAVCVGFAISFMLDNYIRINWGR